VYFFQSRNNLML